MPDTPTLTTDAVEDEIREALQTIYDPEIPINIYDLGLIYEVRVNPDYTAYVKMTLTAPNCPAAGILPSQVEQTTRDVPGVQDAYVELTFDPPYTIEMMSEAAKLELGFM